MELICMGAKYPCVRAEKDEIAGTVTAYSESGVAIFRAKKVKDFSIYFLEGGEWSAPTPAPEYVTYSELAAAIREGVNAVD